MSITEDATNGKWVGQALRRKEDPRMITGRGRYVDDMVVPGMLYMAVVRSPTAVTTRPRYPTRPARP